MKIKPRIKQIYVRGAKHRGRRTIPLLLVMLLTIGTTVDATPITKTMTVTLGESTSRTQSKTIDIPNIQTAKILSTSTGQADIVIDKENGKAIITASNGSYTRRVQTGGSPADSKEVTGQTSANYDKDGYSGTLTKYVYSGSYTPADSKEVTQRETGHHWLDLDTMEYGGRQVPSSVTYNSGGYKGTLSKTSEKETKRWTEGNVQHQKWEANYGGTVTRPESDTRVYRYRGTVSKPDTRTYQNYYQYTVEIEYTDNVPPTLTISNPTQTLTLGKGETLILEGTATDPDQGTLSVQSTLGGILKTTQIQGPAAGVRWELTWGVDEIGEGTYTNLTIKITDGADETTQTYTGTITIDKTNPIMEITIK